MKYNYDRLPLARQLRKLTQKEAAQLAGLSQANLSKAEVGFLELSDENIMKLSEVYDFPLSFFMQNSELSPDGHLYFRRKLSLSAKEINSFVAKVRIFKQIIDTIMEMVEIPDFHLQTYSTSTNSPQDIADKVRYELRLYRGPVPNMTTILENNGIIVIRFDFGTDKIDGLTSITARGRKIMFINNEMANDRVRFSMAHELGHLIMHMDTSPSDATLVEDEAQAFASEFLMPEQDIKSSLYNINFPSLGILKQRWHVSMKSLLVRAHSLGTIKDTTYKNMMINYSKRKYNQGEPLPLKLEEPLLLKSTIKILTENGYSEKDLMDLMHINERDYREWFVPKSKIIDIRMKYE